MFLNLYKNNLFVFLEHVFKHFYQLGVVAYSSNLQDSGGYLGGSPIQDYSKIHSQTLHPNKIEKNRNKNTNAFPKISAILFDIQILIYLTNQFLVISYLQYLCVNKFLVTVLSSDTDYFWILTFVYHPLPHFWRLHYIIIWSYSSGYTPKDKLLALILKLY